jgi:hypothetical protein
MREAAHKGNVSWVNSRVSEEVEYPSAQTATGTPAGTQGQRGACQWAKA